MNDDIVTYGNAFWDNLELLKTILPRYNTEEPIENILKDYDKILAKLKEG